MNSTSSAILLLTLFISCKDNTTGRTTDPSIIKAKRHFFKNKLILENDIAYLKSNYIDKKKTKKFTKFF